MDETKQKLMQRLEDLPLFIKSSEERILAVSDLIAEQKLQVDIIKNDIYVEVSSERIDEKLRFSNKELRDIETDSRLSLNDTAKQLIKAIQANSTALKNEQIQFRFLENQFSAAKHIAALIKDK